MRSCLLLCILASCGVAQSVPVAPVPPDPLELATGAIDTVTTPEQRSAVIALLNRATTNYAMHARVSSPHVLEISFNATASTLFPAATGTLRETWVSGLNWRWDATLGSYTLTRISSNGLPYDAQTPRPIPLRLKMVAQTVFNPMPVQAPRRDAIRTFTASWKGANVTCMLFSGPRQPPESSSGRDWDESEYCINPSTGLLQIASEVPGIYAAYDYSNALHFHGQTLPSGIVVTEAGKTVLQLQLTSVADTDPSNLAPFAATPQMISQGPAVTLMTPFRMQMPEFPADGGGAAFEPVIVHATLDQEGRVQESELLQNNSFSAQALDFSSRQQFGAVPRQPGAPQSQREVYLEFRYQPARAVARDYGIGLAIN